MLGGRQSSDQRMRVVAVAPSRNITQESISDLFNLGVDGVQCQVRHTLDHRLVVFGADTLNGVAQENCPEEMCGAEAARRVTQERYTEMMDHVSINQIDWEYHLKHVILSNNHSLTLLEDVVMTPANKFLVLEPASTTNPGETASYLAQAATSGGWPVVNIQVLLKRSQDLVTFQTSEAYRVWYRREVHNHADGWAQVESGEWVTVAGTPAGTLEDEAKSTIDQAHQADAVEGVVFEADEDFVAGSVMNYAAANSVALAAFGWDRLEGSDTVDRALAMRRLGVYSFTTQLSPNVRAWVAAGMPDTFAAPTTPGPEEEPVPDEGGSNIGMIIGVILFVVMVLAVFAHVSSTKGEEAPQADAVEMKAGRV